MDNLLILQFLIISCVIGICISFFLKIKSYLLIALICTIIFICIELYYNYKLVESSKPNIDPNVAAKQTVVESALSKILDNIVNPQTTSPATTVGATITSDGTLLTILGTTMPAEVIASITQPYKTMAAMAPPMTTMATAS